MIACMPRRRLAWLAAGAPALLGMTIAPASATGQQSSSVTVSARVVPLSPGMTTETIVAVLTELARPSPVLEPGRNPKVGAGLRTVSVRAGSASVSSPPFGP